MGRTIDSNQKPARPRNHPLQKGGRESLPKEPAAWKPQLPSIGKVKLQEELSAQAARAGAETEVSKDTHRARAARASPGCGVGGADSDSGRLRVWGCDREEWAEKQEQRKRGTMLGRAGDSARSEGPPAPLPARGRQLPGQVCFSALPSGPGWRSRSRQPPSARPRPLSFPPGGSRESAGRRRARGEPRARRGAGRARSRGRAKGGGRARGRRRASQRRARGAPGARGSGARCAPRGPAAAPADFRLRRGLRRRLRSVRSLCPGGAACQPSWPASPSAPIRKGSRARAGDLVSCQGCGRRSAGIPAPAPGAGRESEMKRLSPGNTYPSPVQVQLPRSSGAAGPRPRAPGSVLLTMARPL